MNTPIKSIVSGSAGRKIATDLYMPPHKDGVSHPVILFVHGFKGFKDWGIWSLCADFFVSRGFAFLAFNFSHNGTAPGQETEFCDLEAFSQNTFSKEQADLQFVIDWLTDNSATQKWPLDLNRVGLIGHSRGGPIALLHGLRDARVKAVVTWASVARLDYAWQDAGLVERWKKEGILTVINGRTGQEMPLLFELYRDFDWRRNELDVKTFLRKGNKPILIIHGTADPAVPSSHALELHEWASDSSLLLIEGADHVFGGKHPWHEDRLPADARRAVEASADFFEEKLVHENKETV